MTLVRSPSESCPATASPLVRRPLTPAVIAMVEDGWECFTALARETGQTGVRRVTYWEIESQPFDPLRLPYREGGRFPVEEAGGKSGGIKRRLESLFVDPI